MKLTNQQLKRIIREELESVINETKTDDIGRPIYKKFDRGPGTVSGLTKEELNDLAPYVIKQLNKISHLTLDSAVRYAAQDVNNLDYADARKSKQIAADLSEMSSSPGYEKFGTLPSGFTQD